MRKLLFPTLVLLGGCSGSSPSGPGPTVFPSEQLFASVYTGGPPAGKVTVSAMDASTVTWASASPAIATISGTATLGTVTAVAAGSTMITATGGGKTVTVPLTVLSYTDAQLTAGTDAFGSANCAGCHTGQDLDISPSDIGKHTDAQILAAVTAGTNPEGGPISIGAAQHSFPLTGDAQVGISAYLRSLTPGVPVDDD